MKSFSDILLDRVHSTGSRLCVGLDIDAERLASPASPALRHLTDFSRMVIDVTLPFAAAYKMNFAFFERYGSDGYRWLEAVMEWIDGRRLTIADAKRGDISNSARHYASALFDHFGFDAATVSPYMGRDAIEPFLGNRQKGVFVTCLTSNDGASDLQLQRVDGRPLYEKVIELAKGLNTHKNCGLVVGATRSEEVARIRQEVGDMPLLMPGVGAQGGNLETSVREGNRGGVALMNVSRGILYGGDRTAKAIGENARDYQRKINEVLQGNDP
ncbi:MAG: orotidine-5'-phosphate decarboxylase [Fidelibacterota bacterium]